MDTVTQITLGAAVGVAVLGRRIGPRRAAIVGGLLGTLPDLDILWPVDNEVEAFVSHRGFSHSLIVQALVTPIIGEGMVRFVKALRQQRVLTYAAVYLCLSTHALLDAMTVYGTKLLWPLSKEPFAVGSIFIIDPLYTLPLLVTLIWALCLRNWSQRMGQVAAVALSLSTAYQAWCFAAQQMVAGQARELLRQAEISADRLLAIPTPFNSKFWRVIAIVDDRYLNIYLPVFGGPKDAVVYNHPRKLHLAGCVLGNQPYERVAWFSRGFYRLERRDGEIVISDLRMGMTPNYVFRYAVAKEAPAGTAAIPPRRLSGPRGSDEDVEWLLTNVFHGPARRPAEDAAWIATARLATAFATKTARHDCRSNPSTS